MEINRSLRCLFLLILATFILWGVFSTGCSLSNYVPTQKEKEETMKSKETSLKTKKPPLDFEVPLKTETATFALG
ncbi:MAG: hypothetical protein D5R97_06810 [Candidatus Syntrophonatronum acetioxidans]|uniref:Lipoprotein n=1 Tax=Candidatus Syntrophonatronum acetioxidans TaxID=1795816 RepID=A0A424YCQ1_9FIRM|nr:MAG: hypothetical protein D5R97_06810 [Candidatus Syntrophonatronum acetioxidans]